MNSVTTFKLLDADFITRTTSIVDFIVFNNEQKKALEMSRLIEKNLYPNRLEFIENKELFVFYEKMILKLKFIALPLLENNEIVGLIAKNFLEQFTINNYDLAQKIGQKLITIDDYEDRDKLKDEIRAGLINSKAIISPGCQLLTINDWITDYNIKLGSTGKADELKRRQYLMDLYKVPGMSDISRQKLIILFDFYEKLKLSSNTPEGIEEDVVVEIDGKAYIFRNGYLEPLVDPQKNNRIIGPPKTEEEKKIEELTAAKERLSSDLATRVVEEEGIKNMRRVEDLKILASQYQRGSLEWKAIDEEIKKLESKIK